MNDWDGPLGHGDGSIMSADSLLQEVKHSATPGVEEKTESAIIVIMQKAQFISVQKTKETDNIRQG